MLQPQSQTCIDAAHCSLKFAGLDRTCRKHVDRAMLIYLLVLLQAACFCRGAAILMSTCSDDSVVYTSLVQCCCRLPGSACLCLLAAFVGRLSDRPAPTAAVGLPSEGFKEIACCMLTCKQSGVGSAALCWEPACLARTRLMLLQLHPAWLTP